MSVQAAARALLAALALGLLLHGFFGPQFAPQNLATLFVWVHYRGLLVLALLVFGNIFCGICPLVWTRDRLRQFWEPRWNWPRALRNKWLAAAIMAAFLFGYERFGWWSSPRATAVLIAAYFIIAVTVDLLFKKASFCQFICPVGQFNFLASLISPFTVTVKSLATCQSCESKACLKGGTKGRGCELKLFVPKKSGNLNCTFCMDCARACPHDNVQIGPAHGLAPLASGRFWQRADLTALIVVFTFGAVLNAFAMVAPARQFSLFGLSVATLVVTPLGFLLLCEVWRWTIKVAPSPRLLAPALIPMGFAIWLGHYSFHFLTGALTFVPVVASFFPRLDLDPMIWAGFPMGLPVWSVTPIQYGCLVLGTAASLYVAHKRAQVFANQRALAFAAPWHILILGIAVFAAWVFTLPMDMRGTFVGG